MYVNVYCMLTVCNSLFAHIYNMHTRMYVSTMRDIHTVVIWLLVPAGYIYNYCTQSILLLQMQAVYKICLTSTMPLT